MKGLGVWGFRGLGFRGFYIINSRIVFEGGMIYYEKLEQGAP